MNDAWPDLATPGWQDTAATVQLGTRIVGESGPVHFLWGAFDLAVTSAAAPGLGDRDRCALERPVAP